MISNRKIFFSVIDWGLGHATRSAPIIQSLLQSNQLTIGVTEKNKFFFDQAFPQVPQILLPSYNIQYSKNIPLWLKLLMQWPKINRVIRDEKKLLAQLILEKKFDLVISDNRFGLSHKTVESIFITHQLFLKTPVFSQLANKINRSYINEYSEVWVPDFPEHERRLAGDLVDAVHINIPVTYIGPQSYLSAIKPNEQNISAFDYLILLSGEEPQRNILEEMLIKKFRNTEKKIVLVRGTNLKKRPVTTMEVIDFAYGEALLQLIGIAKTVICRSGYSSLMDLHLLHKKDLILIPTPGQTEQEYLDSYWQQKFGTKTVLQKEIEGFEFNS